MLNRNLDLNILDFVTVGFEGLAHTIDALGGIEIEIDEEERGYLNQYLHDMHLELGTDETPVEKSGKVVVTGIQATAYSRIRYTAGDDFRRAERQRIVLEKTLEKAKNASPTTLVDVANNVIGDMATSLSSREIVNLILMAQKLELKDTGGIPREDARDFTNIEAGSAVMPDTLEDNVVWLHDFLFDNKDYHVSDDVKERNDWIVNNLYPVSYY
jgi:anionic cell wall polymer biosynthesis LytR-Cps2A-Psr (LCP) family protein